MNAGGNKSELIGGTATQGSPPNSGCSPPIFSEAGRKLVQESFFTATKIVTTITRTRTERPFVSNKMPGRQSHGRSLMAAPKAKAGGKKGSKARSQKNALNAFGIAQDMYPTKYKRTPRARELDAEIERKHGRDEAGEDEDEDEDEEEQPRRKKAKGPSRADGDGEDGSDSEGNEWRLGGLRDDDEDSEIESDDAFGDSDNEKFEEYSFRGSKSKPVRYRKVVRHTWVLLMI